MLSTCSPTLTRAQRLRIMRPFYLLFALFMLFNFAVTLANPVKDSPLAWTLDLCNGASMVAMLIAAAIGVARQCDEFQRTLLTQAMVCGVGGMLAIDIIWGLLEVHTSIPRMDVLVNFPIFISITAIAKVALFRRNPAGEE